MTMSPNTLVLLGASSDSFYVACGRRHVAQNMPLSFTNHANSALSVPATLWISMSQSMEHWVDFNVATEDYHFNANLQQDVHEQLAGTNGKMRAEFITFLDVAKSGAFFAKGPGAGEWRGTLPSRVIKTLSDLQRDAPAIANDVTGVLFGKGDTSIYLTSTAFFTDLDGEAGADDHPLNKVCREFDEGWSIERGSTLCFYDSRYFFLKFKRSRSNTMELRWNLPPAAGATLAELRQIAHQPDELLAICQEEEKWAQIGLQRINATSRLRVNASHDRMLRSGVFGVGYRSWVLSGVGM
ncbi:hypothetical protein DFH09DRAFT_1161614 [Mycena vulgaris]|nr:hypothetical protein DFH09DRAFT_1161614 [Mycena vulgaris]